MPAAGRAASTLRPPSRPDLARVPAREPQPADLLHVDARLPDEPERLRGDGRPAPRRGLRPSVLDGGRRPRGDQHVRRSRARRGQGDRPPGVARRAQAGPARHAGRADRLRRPRVRTSRAGPPFPGGRHVPSTGRGARARATAGARVRPGPRRAADRLHGRDDRARRPSGQRRRPSGRLAGQRAGREPRRPLLDDLGLAADRLRLRQDLHLLHRPVQPRAGAQPTVRRHRGRSPRDRRRRIPRADASRPERQQLRPRPAGRGAFRPHRHRAIGRTPPGPAIAARSGRAAARHRRHPRRRRPAGDSAPALHHLASVGPLRSADRRHGQLRVGGRAPPPADPVRRRRDARSRMGRQYTVAHYQRAPGAYPRGRARNCRLDRRDRRLLRRDGGAVRRNPGRPRGDFASTPSSPRPTRLGPALRRCAWRTTCRRR